MTRDEIKAALDEIPFKIKEIKLAEDNLYAELGKKIFPDLPDDAYPELIAQIKATETRFESLVNEQISMETEFKQRIAAATCFYCKAVNAEGSVFCEECGKKIEKPREYCDACGTMNYPGQKYCGQCGTKLPE